MRDLDSYQVFCALELLKSKERQKTQQDQQVKDPDDVVCACAKYLSETL